MARRKNSEAIKLQNVFPEDYKQMAAMLSVKGNKIKINPPNYCFDVHPEYDLLYKLRCMVLANNKEDRYTSFEKLRKESGYKHKGNTYWKDHMFQIPGIDKMLGIKKDYFIPHLNEILQIPAVFLHLAGIWADCIEYFEKKIYRYSREVWELIEIALDAYEQGKKSNEFNEEQLEECSYFLFGENVFSNYPGVYDRPDESGYACWINLEDEFKSYQDIKLRFEKFLESHEGIEKTRKINVDNTYEGGNPLNCPKHMRAIILGLCRFQGTLPFSLTKENVSDATLWRFHDIPVTLDVDESIEQPVYTLAVYLTYKKVMEKYCASIHRCRDIGKISEYLERYYKFCIGTLYEIFDEETKYREAARDSFERLFSLYLFEEETDMIYQKIQSAARSILEKQTDDEKNDIEQIEMQLVEYVTICFSADILHEIFCSPGIYHRILLARYINKICPDASELEWRFNNEPVIFDSWDNDLEEENEPVVFDSQDNRLEREIQTINQIYLYEEKRYICNVLFKNENEIFYDSLKELYKGDYGSIRYEDFYEDLKEKMKKENAKGKGAAPDAKNMAEKILEEGKFKSQAYKKLHFWVIFSSFLSRNKSFPKIKTNYTFETTPEKIAKKMGSSH